MTEGEFNRCDDPQAMLDFLRATGKLSERKARLFAVACCRSIWDRLEQEGSRHAVRVAELFADGLAGPKQLQLAWEISHETRDPVPSWGGALACASYATHKSAWKAAEGAARTSQVAFSPAWDAACRVADRTHRRSDREAVREVARREMDSARKAHAALLHCIFGNPFRPPPAVKPSLFTPAIMALARCVYDERKLPEGTFDLGRLAELAQALEDAGCIDAELLGHLRGPGPHYRGCDAVDAVLCKS